jgi:hypothetical protein
MKTINKNSRNIFDALLVSLGLLFALSTSSFTYAQSNKTGMKAVKALTAEESELLLALEESAPLFSVEDILASLEPKTEKVIVYDYSGNLLKETALDKKTLFSVLPKGAELLMRDGTTAYYLSEK